MADTYPAGHEPRYRLFAPDGSPVHHIITWTTCSASIDEVAESGHINTWSHGDFPDFEDNTLINLTHVSGVDGDSFLRHHCRPVLCPWDFSAWDERKIDAWPDEIIDACTRAEEVAWALHCHQLLRRGLPSHYLDTTMTAALDTLVKGRLEDELKQCEAIIAAFREGRVEVTVLPEEDDEYD